MSLALLTEFDWSGAITAGAAIATTVIAYLALRTWRRQDTAKREVDFLDAAVDAVQAYTVEIGHVIALMRSVQIGFEAHKPSGSDDRIAGAIAYIESKSEVAARRLQEELEASRSSMTQLRFLAAKGQIFDFEGYDTFSNAISRLVRQYGRASSLYSMVASPTWNWDHPEVRSLLQKLIKIDPSEMTQNVNDDHDAIIQFCQATYRTIYKK